MFAGSVKSSLIYVCLCVCLSTPQTNCRRLTLFNFGNNLVVSVGRETKLKWTVLELIFEAECIKILMYVCLYKQL